ncbi:MAG TPA: phosphoheptose isomerase [Planctomycetes bacterium]|nr:phosphoheptose isomerase [Planctomycetota bacterium]
MDFAAYRRWFAEVLERIDAGAVEAIADLFARARAEGRTVFVIGNGGSAANASHFCEDLVKGTLRDFDRQRRLKVLSLTDNAAAIMAWANDEGYERVFVEQLRTYAAPGDLLLAISGSGNSPNVTEAAAWANDHGMITIGLTGFDGGALARMARHNLRVPIDNMGAAEAAHDVVFHYLVETLCGRFAHEDGIPPRS